MEDGGLSGCLYISGVPGTGKTATVTGIIRALEAASERGDIPRFQYISINGMKLSSPQQFYSILWEAIAGDKASPQHAAEKLEAFFSTPSPRRHCCVVLVDELDQLVTAKQRVIYNLFDWPRRPHARLLIIGIANTMDLPERMLPRIHSRLGLFRLAFAPYTHQQIQAWLPWCSLCESAPRSVPFPPPLPSPGLLMWLLPFCGGFCDGQP